MVNGPQPHLIFIYKKYRLSEAWNKPVKWRYKPYIYMLQSNLLFLSSNVNLLSTPTLNFKKYRLSVYKNVERLRIATLYYLPPSFSLEKTTLTHPPSFFLINNSHKKRGEVQSAHPLTTYHLPLTTFVEWSGGQWGGGGGFFY